MKYFFFKYYASRRRRARIRMKYLFNDMLNQYLMLDEECTNKLDSI